MDLANWTVISKIHYIQINIYIYVCVWPRPADLVHYY